MKNKNALAIVAILFYVPAVFFLHPFTWVAWLAYEMSWNILGYFLGAVTLTQSVLTGIAIWKTRSFSLEGGIFTIRAGKCMF